ncbi:MAG: NADH-quinone oxidoreductase subunit NuoG [Syntrophotaleaceae bacterium]
MPTLIIDNQSITVPEGTNVLEAAKRLGIVIPHFCYHEALGSVGACRLCAMNFVDGPIKGIQMSCMVPAKDGMVVSTLEPQVVEYRAQVIEWLMLNHPHDCPVCDEGGECQLQDMTIAGGHSIRRYTGKKKTYMNQDLGPFVYQEMNRCIQCYRCVRTYQDYCGGTDFGVMGVNQRLFFGRFREGPLESPFAGNITDVCPTGVFTSKPFRFTSRYWDLEQAPSVCPHCSLGCAVIPGARYRELQRVKAGVNRVVNGFFICDRGRYGYGYVNLPDRPRYPRIDGDTVTWETALDTLGTRLANLIGRHGSSAVALVGSGRASLEANYLLREWSEQLGAPAPAYSVHPPRDRAARAVAAQGDRLNASLADVRSADLIVVIGSDPLNEGPALALALRQAVRSGGRVVIYDPRPVELPCAAEHHPCPPEKLPDLISALSETASSESSDEAFGKLVQALREAKKPVLAGGADLLGDKGLNLLFSAAEKLSSEERPCRVFPLLAEANSYGAALLAGQAATFDQVLSGIEEGQIKALICLETDPLDACPDPRRASRALSGLEMLAVFDHLPTTSVRKADLFLPTTAIQEGSGTLINNEGRMLRFDQVFSPGQPIRQSGGGSHPPRIFAAATPGSLPRPAWSLLADLIGMPGDLDALQGKIAASDPRLKGLAGLKAGEEGLRVETEKSIPGEMTFHKQTAPEGWRLLSCQNLYGSEPLGRLSPALAPVLPELWAWISLKDARQLQLAEGDSVRLTVMGQEFQVPVRVSGDMAEKMIIVPHLPGTSLEVFHPGTGLVPCQVEKASSR